MCLNEVDYILNMIPHYKNVLLRQTPVALSATTCIYLILIYAYTREPFRAIGDAFCLHSFSSLRIINVESSKIKNARRLINNHQKKVLLSLHIFSKK
jgi:hypothetical protein